MRYHKLAIFFLGLILTINFTACENIIDNQISSKTTEPKTSSVTLTIPRYSTDLVNSLNTMSDRMMILFPSLTIKLYDDGDNLIQTQSYSQSNSDTLGSYVVTLNDIPWGSDYHLSVDIFNQNEGSAPLLSGTSDHFDVGRGDAIVYVPIIPNRITAALSASFGSSLSGSVISTELSSEMQLSSLGGEKWYTLTPSSDASYKVTVTASSLASMAYFVVYDSQGTRICYNSGPTATNYLDAVSGETYYIGVIVAEIGSTSTQSYTISLTEGSIDPDAYEENDTIGTAYDASGINAFTENISYNMTLHNDGTPDEDWYAIPVTSGEQYSFYLTSPDNTYLNLLLCDSDENSLAYSADLANNTQLITWTADGDGTAYIHIYDYDDNICEYTFSYSTDPPPYLSGTPLSLNTPSAPVSVTDDRFDWFTFTGSALESYIIEVNGDSYSWISDILNEIDGTLGWAYTDYIEQTRYGLMYYSDTIYIAIESSIWRGEGSYTVTVRPPADGTLSAEVEDCSQYEGKDIYLGLWEETAEIGVDDPVALWSGNVAEGVITPSPFVSSTDGISNWIGSGIYELFGFVDNDNSVTISGDPLEGPTFGDTMLGSYDDYYSTFYGSSKLIDGGMILDLDNNDFDDTFGV